MAKKPTIPCTRCGTLLWSGPTTVADELRVCRPCRRAERASTAAAKRRRRGVWF